MSSKSKEGLKGWPRFEAGRTLIPGGSGTLTKAPRFRPEEPAIIKRGKGCRFWDADENEYIDFRCALGPITLGYCHPEIDEAIRKQLELGIAFGHPTEGEYQLAEELVKVLPCAESVRFLKTGGEAMAATIKLARAFTGRDMLITCGYHGWVNSVIGTKGILRGAVENHRSFEYGDLAAIERLLQEHEGKVAAVSLAGAYNVMHEGDRFPAQLRELTRKHGVLLIVDEIVTGFRLRIGGLHEYYDFLPDLAVFSKGMANGMPISVFTGRKEIMDLCAKEAVVSSTFSGEALSVAAALALLKIYREKDVIGHLWRAGEQVGSGMTEIFRRHGLPVVMKGLAPCRVFEFQSGNDEENGKLQRALFRSFFAHGVCMNIICYVNFSHSREDIDEALERMDRACKELRIDSESSVTDTLPRIGAAANLAPRTS